MAVFRPVRPVVRLVTFALRALSVSLQSWLSLSTIYLLVLLVAGARPRARTGPATAPGPRFLTLVPAHDEALSVGQTVSSLDAQDYPSELSEVVVIADNCSDSTASIARAAGATVWERDDPANRGKGAALAWALDRVRRDRPAVEAIAIVDADCRATPNLLSALAVEITRGADAVQASYEVANVSESPQAGLRGAGFALKHVLRARGRARLGLSPGLFGTGMAFSADLLRAVAWSTSVTEDTELFLRLVEGGYRIAYAGGCAVVSPMPTTAAGAHPQQLRWETGNAQLRRTRSARLLWRGLIGRNREMLGAAAELALPSQTTLVAGETLLIGVDLVIGRRRQAITAVITLLGQATYVIGGLWAVHGSTSSLRILAHAPGFVAGRLKVLVRVSAGRGSQAWERTERSGSA